MDLLVLKVKERLDGQLPRPLLPKEVGDDGRLSGPVTMAMTMTMTVTLAMALSVSSTPPGAASPYDALHLHVQKIPG